MIGNTLQQSAFNILIANFERVYPNITVNASYYSTSAQYSLTTTELASGNAPDLIVSWPGCGQKISICVLAKDGYLAPMIGVPWVRYTSRLTLSESKFGKALYVYSPGIQFVGVFTNDTLFTKLGLQVPQTFAQLLTVCRKAKAAGTVALVLNSGSLGLLASDLALPTVYARDPHWGAEIQAGKVSFDGTAGWHEALQEIVEMSSAGCFQPGVVSTSSDQEYAQFAQGQALMAPTLSSLKGQIAALVPAFAFSFHPIPNANNGTVGMIQLSSGPAVNAHSPAANQAAAQEFVNFVARPKQDALETQVAGGLSQYAFEKGQLPSYMSSFRPLFASHQYALNPTQRWWNAAVVGAINQYGDGLLTGQTSIDDVLNAADAAWQQGPG